MKHLTLCIFSVLVFSSTSYAAKNALCNGMDMQKGLNFAVMNLNGQNIQGFSLEDRDLANICLGFINGFIATNAFRDQVLAEQTKGKYPPMYCVPDGVTVGQSYQIILKYLKNNPEKLHFDAVVLIHLAIVDSFPCK